MKRTLIYLCVLASSFTPIFAQADTGRCVLQVNGKNYLNGRCDIGFTDKQGSFTIGVSDKRRAKYFAYVTMEEDGAHGYWNETPDASHAHTSLGILKQHGACWENASARVCAYK